MSIYGRVCCLCNQNCTRFAIIKKRNIFNYVGWGLFEILNDDIPFEKGFICDLCLKQFICKAYKGTECGSCHELFQNMWDVETNDAFGCSATISETNIYPGEGSCFDGDTIEFIHGKPDYLNIGDEICNTCLKQLLKQKNVCKHIEPPWFIDNVIEEEKEVANSDIDQADPNRVLDGHDYPWKHIIITNFIKHAKR